MQAGDRIGSFDLLRAWAARGGGPGFLARCACGDQRVRGVAAMERDRACKHCVWSAAQQARAEREARHEATRKVAGAIDRTRRMTLDLIRSGEIRREKRCAHCPITRGLHAHHPDYSDPRRVVFLCRSCHRREHVRLLAEGRDPALLFALEHDQSLTRPLAASEGSIA